MNGKPVKVPVVGVFELDGAGKLTAWRDYLDWKDMIDQVTAVGIDTTDADTDQLTPPPDQQ